MAHLRAGYHTICWGGVVGDPVGVTSVKDLFYRSNGDVARALAEIAAEGYDGFEVFDGNLLGFPAGPAGLRAAAQREGLELVAVYSGGNFIYSEILDEELWRVERAAVAAAEAGSRFLVVGGGAQRATGIRADDYDRLADALDRVCDLAQAHGLVPCFHPHLTTIVESPEQVARLLARSRIPLCADTAHLAAGGGDPAAMVREYADRLVYVHLKDLHRESVEFLPLGEGELDLAAVVNALHDIDYDGWVTVELDAYPGEPRTAAGISRQYLRQLTKDRS